ncbi:MAG: glycoside hydrolase family 2 TIM barrel-domain containing protein [Pseudomonadota bacterium]
MRLSFIFAITSLLMTACTPNSDSSQTAVKVEIVKTAQGYTLLRGGEPYAVNGAGMAANDIERFAAHGGNSVRTWSTGSDPQETLAWLDDAHEHGVTVAMGLSMGKERHGFDYDDKDAVAEQLARVREEVLRYKDHPAVLLWIIGNELDHRYTNPAVWDAVNDVAEMIHDVDPYHPVTTTTAGFHPAVNEAILDRAPALDFISFQLYGSIFGLEDNLKAQAFEHPFMITEWGAIGWWEMEKTDWDVPFETTSSQKADIFLRAYQEVIEPLESQIIGSYVFYWGQKQERTPTWFGMLTEEGHKTEAVDAMQFAWTGEWPANRTPRVKGLLVDGKNGRNSIVLMAGKTYAVAFEVSDPEDGNVTYRWELKKESAATSEGGDYEEPIASLGDVIADTSAAATEITAPAPGMYRLFAYAEDDEPRVAHANMPILVVDKPIVIAK